MSGEAWKNLIIKYADGRQPCNCGNAYYSNCGQAHIYNHEKDQWDFISDHPVCDGGCATSIISAREYIAGKILG